MKDVKLKEKFEKAFEAFFESGETDSIYLEKLSDDEIKKEPNQKVTAKNVFKILKQVFLFLPGTFFTFYAWMAMMLFGLHSPLALTVLLIPPILMVLGMGKLRNIKHWMMPLSVIILGSIIGIVTGNIQFLRSFMMNFSNVILLFPLALIAAILAKDWLDIINENNPL